MRNIVKSLLLKTFVAAARRWRVELSALATLATTAVPVLAQPSRPNVVVILSDDAGYADFGFQNQFTGLTTKFKTPRLDQLAQQSAVFSNAHLSASLCGPSRAGLATGLSGARFGVEYNFVNNLNSPSVNEGVPVGQTLIFERMKSLGYSTSVFGKWDLGAAQPQQPQNQGVDEFYGFLQGGWGYFASQTPSPILRNTTPISYSTEPSFNNVPNDPTLGRHLTDALGDEASKYIANHAADANPFFMYVPFNAPHSPFQIAKASDLAQFNPADFSGDIEYKAAGLTYGMDRNIGQILDRLDDPNRDGNLNDSIADNTIVIFLNDNGVESNLAGSNAPLFGLKGSLYEGGTRTPMLIRGQGLVTGVKNDLVSSLDVFTTAVAIAGGAQPTVTDGVNLLPFLTGQQPTSGRDRVIARQIAGYSIQEGDWKLTNGTEAALAKLYHLNANGSGETVDLFDQNPAIVSQLIHDYVDWEVLQAKPTIHPDAVGISVNRFNEFRYRSELSTAMNWRQANAWRDNLNPATIASIKAADPGAVAILVFETRDDASYTANNDAIRSTGQAPGQSRPTPHGFDEFMLSELRLQGSFAGGANRSGTLTGFPLMFVNNLAGAPPKISLNHNKAAANDFTFNVNMDLVLYNSLLIAGDGNASFSIGGVMKNFYNPSGVTKEGTSKVTFAGLSTYTGPTVVRGGEVRITAAAAGLNGTSSVTVESGGTLTLTNGLINTGLVSVQPGGNFAFTGGRVQTGGIAGALVNNGGTLAGDATVDAIAAAGSYTQTSGTLNLRLAKNGASKVYDSLDAAGAVQLAGILDVGIVDIGSGLLTLANLDFFDVVSADGGLTGTFNSLQLPSLAPGLAWQTLYGPTSLRLLVTNTGVSADFNADGFIDGADLLAWQQGLGISSGATRAMGDANNDGQVTVADLDVFKASFPAGASFVSRILVQRVPEPAAWTLALLAAGLVARRRTS